MLSKRASLRTLSPTARSPFVKLSAQPENLLEAIALRFGMVPTPLGDTHVAFMLARTIMVATKVGLFAALARQPATAPQVAQRCETSRKLLPRCSIPWYIWAIYNLLILITR